MIRLVIGMFIMYGAVGGLEVGNSSFPTAILLSSIGVVIAVWGLVGMNEKGHLL